MNMNTEPALLHGHTGSPQCVCFHPVLPLLASCGESSTGKGELLIYHYMDTTAPPSILLLDAPGLALSWYCPKVEDGVDDESSWGGLFVGSGCDLLLVTWEGGGGDGGTTPTPTTKPIVTTEDDISALCAHPTKPILACCDDSGVITIIDAAKACVVRVLRKGGHTSLATSVVFLPLPVGSSLLLSGGCDHTLKLWDGVSPEGAKGPLLTVHANTLLAGAAGGGEGGGGATAQSLEDLSEDDLLDSLVKQNAVSAAAPSKESTYNPNPPFIHALSLLEGNLVAVAFGNGSVGVVSINTPPTSVGGGKARKRPTLTLHWHRREAYLSAACAVAALPGGYLLACGGKDSTIALWPWKEVVEGGEGGEPFRAWQHTGGRRKPRKVNWMAVEGGRGVLVVADTSSSLSLYTTTLGGV